jgi:hypothetical protein
VARALYDWIDSACNEIQIMAQVKLSDIVMLFDRCSRVLPPPLSAPF